MMKTALEGKVLKDIEERLPGVKAVITHHDVPRKLFNRGKGDVVIINTENELRDKYVLDDRVRFVGDAVAAYSQISI